MSNLERPASSADQQPAKVPGTGQRVWRYALALVLLSGLSVAGWAWARKTAPAPAPTAATARPVQTAMPERHTLPLEIEYRGEVVAETVELAARSAGQLLEVNKQIGERFEQGATLAVVDARETERLLAEARAQIRAAEAAQLRSEAQLAASKVEAARTERLARENLVGEQELVARRAAVDVASAEVAATEAQRVAAQARASLYRQQIADSKLLAPFDGAVAQRYLEPGATVSAGTPILRLVRSGPTRIRFRVSELHIGRLEPGAKFEVVTRAQGERRFQGQVKYVGAEVERSDRSVTVEGVLDDPESGLKPGAYAVVVVHLGVLDDALTVPASAVITRLDQQGTPETGVKLIADGRAKYVPVQVLTEHEGRAAVTGIEPSDAVISFGAEAVAEGAKIRPVESIL